MDDMRLSTASGQSIVVPTSTVIGPKPLTAEEYSELPDDGQRTELVRGVVVSRDFPLPPSNSSTGRTSAVIEVVSATNTRRQIAVKTGEYLNAGVNVVCIVDPVYRSVNLYFPDQPTKELEGDDTLTFADLPGFNLPVSKFFE